MMNMHDIEIRETRPEDAGKVLEYLKRIGGETDNLTFGAEGLPFTVAQEAAYLRQMLEASGSAHFTAWQGGEIVGDGSLRGMSGRMGHRANLGLSVVKAEWGRGIGRRILERLLEYGRLCGVEIFELEVRSDNNRAIGLYESFGFVRVGTYPGYTRVNGAYYDADIMCLDLRQGIDVPATRRYYAALTEADLCDCAYCRSYRARVKEAYPALADALAKLGVDVLKPLRLSFGPRDAEGLVNYFECQYVVLGCCPAGFRLQVGDVVVEKEQTPYPCDDVPEPHFVLRAGCVILKYDGEE